jgi:hypothetical protein
VPFRATSIQSPCMYPSRENKSKTVWMSFVSGAVKSSTRFVTQIEIMNPWNRKVRRAASRVIQRQTSFAS